MTLVVRVHSADAVYHRPELLTRTYPRERSVSDSQSQKSCEQRERERVVCVTELPVVYGTYPLNPNNKLLNHKVIGYSNRLTDSELPIHSLATLTVTHKSTLQYIN